MQARSVDQKSSRDLEKVRSRVLAYVIRVQLARGISQGYRDLGKIWSREV
jgi:hypothetical protein